MTTDRPIPQLISIDNTIVRFRVGDARAYGVPENVIERLKIDVEAIAGALTYASSTLSGTTFRVEWGAPGTGRYYALHAFTGQRHGGLASIEEAMQRLADLEGVSRAELRHEDRSSSAGTEFRWEVFRGGLHGFRDEAMVGTVGDEGTEPAKAAPRDITPSRRSL